MEQRNESMRERLLARLPQPENLAAYREETTSLLAKHERAQFWEKWSTEVLAFCALGVFFMISSTWGQRLGRNTTVASYAIVGIFFFMSQMWRLQYNLNRNQVNLLKEVKQVQLQVLELQASLKKES